MRQPILAANWKMHKTVRQAVAFVEAFLPHVGSVAGREVVIAPPFTATTAYTDLTDDAPVLQLAHRRHRHAVPHDRVRLVHLVEVEPAYT